MSECVNGLALDRLATVKTDQKLNDIDIRYHVYVVIVLFSPILQDDGMYSLKKP